MASINLYSPVFDLLLSPALPLFSECSHSRHCPELSDARWLTLGVARCIEAHPSSRSFLQTLASNAPDLCPDHSHWFASLKSERRLRLCRQLNAHLRSLLCRTLPDALRVFPCLNDYAIYAGDGHSHAHACHYPLDAKGNRLAVGHLYTRNLRSGALSHLCVADQAQRDKEHDMRGLKRQNIQQLRHGTPQGGKTLIIWDRAGIDFAQWFRWKQGSGIYMLSRCKENMSLMVCGTLSFDSKDAINAGVLADELVSPVTCGVTLRRIRFWDGQSGRIFEFITNLTETDVPPGVLAHLYRMRWDIEKTFDEIKNKLHEKKAWASSATAKSMQATFICLTHNLMLLMEQELKQNQGVSNRAEDQRRAKRLERVKFAARKGNQVVPMPLKLTQRCTVITVKMVRWIATHLWKSVSVRQASVALAALYAHL